MAIGRPKCLPIQYPMPAETFSPIQQAAVPEIAPSCLPAKVQTAEEGTGKSISIARIPTTEKNANEGDASIPFSRISPSSHGSNHDPIKTNGRIGMRSTPTIRKRSLLVGDFIDGMIAWRQISVQRQVFRDQKNSLQQRANTNCDYSFAGLLPRWLQHFSAVSSGGHRR